MLKNTFTLAAAAAFLASLLGLAGCNGNTAGGGSDTGPSSSDDVAATVNGVAIPMSKIDQQIDQQIKQSGSQAQPPNPIAVAATRLQYLDQLIQEEALFQRAQKENVVPTEDEVKQELQSRIQQTGMSQDDYQKRLQDLGQTEDELKTDIRRELAIQKLQEKVTSTIPPPTEAELRKTFEENKTQLVAPRGLDLSDIVVDPNNNGAQDDAIGPDAAAKKAQDIAAAVKGGADFATVARARSEDSHGPQGGAIGFFPDTQMAQSFPQDVAQRLATLQVGQTTEPIKSQDGRWHIFKLNDKREQAQEYTYDQVKQRIAQTLTDQRKQVVLSALVREAVSSASIRNNLASQIIAHPDTFGALRPSPLTEPKPGQAPPQTPQPAANQNQPEAQPGGPVNAGNKNEGTKK